MHPVTSLFAKNKIDLVAIIDDYFDPPHGEEGTENIESFWDAIKEDANARAELQNLGCEVKDIEDINDEVLKKMWDGRAELKFLKGAFEASITTLKKEEKEIGHFCQHLKDHYGIKADCFGTQALINETQYKLIFIDYYLGPTDTTASKAAAARKSIFLAKGINERCKTTPHRPIFILISSFPVDQTMRNEFRINADIMGGMFYFMEKHHISDRRRLLLELYPIARALESSYAIEHFINSFLENIESVSKDFSAQVASLSISDYAYIQKLSLPKEGHLGDYISWLFGEHLIRLLHNKMRDDRTKINGLVFEDLPPSQFIPSLELTDIYQSSLFEFISENEPLHLGNIFIKDLDVYMVINAECDLVFTTIPGGRSVDPELAVLLIQGRLVTHTENDPKGTNQGIRVEFFERIGQGKKEMFRITWYLDRVRAIKYGECDLEKEGYKLTCRLKLPYALKIQNAFASNLTRVGVPVAPPIYSALRVELFCEGKGGKAERLLELREGAAHLFFMTNKDQCILRNDFIYDLLGKISEATAKLEELAVEYRGAGGQDEKVKELEKRKKILERLNESDGEQLRLLDPIPLPKVKGASPYNSIYVTRGEMDIEGNPYASGARECPLWLNFIDT
jgi:hypothetical protein